MTRGEDLIWRQAGGAYYAETEGRIVALLYWYGEEVHYLHGPGAEAAEPPTPGWFVVMADEPDDHRMLDAPPAPRAGEVLSDLTETTQVALDAATHVVVACLNRS